MSARECHVTISYEWGNDRIYPVNEIAHLFARVAGQETLSVPALRAVKELGFAVTASGDEKAGERFMKAMNGEGHMRGSIRKKRGRRSKRKAGPPTQETIAARVADDDHTTTIEG